MPTRSHEFGKTEGLYDLLVFKVYLFIGASERGLFWDLQTGDGATLAETPGASMLRFARGNI